MIPLVLLLVAQDVTLGGDALTTDTLSLSCRVYDAKGEGPATISGSASFRSGDEVATFSLRSTDARFPNAVNVRANGERRSYQEVFVEKADGFSPYFYIFGFGKYGSYDKSGYVLVHYADKRFEGIIATGVCDIKSETRS